MHDLSQDHRRAVVAYLPFGKENSINDISCQAPGLGLLLAVTLYFPAIYRDVDVAAIDLWMWQWETAAPRGCKPGYPGMLTREGGNLLMARVEHSIDVKV